MGTLIIILGLLLTAICTVFIVKNFLVYFKGSNNGFANVAILIFAVLALICCLVSILGGFKVNQINDILKMKQNLSPEIIKSLQADLTATRQRIIHSTILEFISFAISYIIFKLVQKKIKKQLKKPKRTWDWNKID
ncbi:hypothetical protein ACFIJ5_13610 [Haloimpatiens sp. FM7330]|uniref:hypothetical protein n=1 Tax=Haloimpatiens sp. FM7330 TaxID=3298610 RepID=UPI00363EF6C6